MEIPVLWNFEHPENWGFQDPIWAYFLGWVGGKPPTRSGYCHDLRGLIIDPPRWLSWNSSEEWTSTYSRISIIRVEIFSEEFSSGRKGWVMVEVCYVYIYIYIKSQQINGISSPMSGILKVEKWYRPTLWKYGSPIEVVIQLLKVTIRYRHGQYARRSFYISGWWWIHSLACIHYDARQPWDSFMPSCACRPR